jgi:hypothetical protein
MPYKKKGPDGPDRKKMHHIKNKGVTERGKGGTGYHTKCSSLANKH